MDDTDKIVAAILAAAKMSAKDMRTASDYVAEYETLLRVLQKSKAQTGTQGDKWSDVTAELDKGRNL